MIVRFKRKSYSEDSKKKQLLGIVGASGLGGVLGSSIGALSSKKGLRHGATVGGLTGIGIGAGAALLDQYIRNRQKTKKYSNQQDESDKKKSSLSLGTLVHGAIGRPCTEGKIFSDVEDHTKRNLAIIGGAGALGTGGAILTNNIISKKNLGKAVKKLEENQANLRNGINTVPSKIIENKFEELNDLYRKGKISSQADLHYELDKFKKANQGKIKKEFQQNVEGGAKKLENAMKKKRNAVNKKIAIGGLGLTAAAGLAYGGRKLYKKYKNEKSNGETTASETNDKN